MKKVFVLNLRLESTFMNFPILHVNEFVIASCDLSQKTYFKPMSETNSSASLKFKLFFSNCDVRDKNKRKYCFRNIVKKSRGF